VVTLLPLSLCPAVARTLSLPALRHALLSGRGCQQTTGSPSRCAEGGGARNHTQSTHLVPRGFWCWRTAFVHLHHGFICQTLSAECNTHTQHSSSVLPNAEHILVRLIQKAGSSGVLFCMHTRCDVASYYQSLALAGCGSMCWAVHLLPSMDCKRLCRCCATRMAKSMTRTGTGLMTPHTQQTLEKTGAALHTQHPAAQHRRPVNMRQMLQHCSRPSAAASAEQWHL
jgi:hypothetical protein